MKLRNTKITRQLGIGLGFVFLLVLALGFFNLYNSINLWEKTDQLYNHPIVVERAVGALKTDVLNIRLEMNQLIIENNKQELQNHIISIESNEADAYLQINILFLSYQGSINDIENINNILQQYKPIREETISMLESGNLDEAAQRVRIDGVGGIHIQKLINALSIVNEYTKIKADQYYLDAQRYKDQNIFQLAAIILIILILFVVIGFIFKKVVLIPLKELISVTRAFQQGDLETRSHFKSSNEFGMLSSAFNKMTETVQNEIQNKDSFENELIHLKDNLEISIAKKTNDLVNANTELAFQNDEKEKRAAELAVANTELTFQNNEKEKRAAELVIANTELAFQNDEKEKRAAELAVANTELTFQNNEKEKRAAELVIANTELAFQNDEKEKRAAELAVANTELTFQNNEKEKRAAELVIANTDLAFQKEKIIELNNDLEFRVIERTAEYKSANKELEALSYSISHDLKAPLRHVLGFVSLLSKKYLDILPEEGRQYINKISYSGNYMSELIDGLLHFSRTGRVEMIKRTLNMNEIVNSLVQPIKDQEMKRKIEWDIGNMPPAYGDFEMMKSVWSNLIENAVKFTKNKELAKITIGADENEFDTVYYVKDNGVGFDMNYTSKLFAVFQRLHSREDYEGTGIGLATVQKIITRHGGEIRGIGVVGESASFYFTLIKRKDRL